MAAPITTKALKTVRSVAGLSMVCIILASVNIDAVAPETLSQLTSSVINENKMMSKVPTEVVDKHLTKAEDELTNLEPLLESASRPADPDELRHPDGADESVNTFYYGYYNYRYCYYYYYGYTYSTYCGYLTYQPTCCGTTCCASSYNYCNQYDQCSYYADDDDDDDFGTYNYRYCESTYCGYLNYQPDCCGSTCCTYDDDYCNSCDKTNNVVSIVSIVIYSVVFGVGGILLVCFGTWWYFCYYKPRQAAALEYMKATTVAIGNNTGGGQLQMQPVSRAEPTYYVAGAVTGPSQPYYVAGAPTGASQPYFAAGVPSGPSPPGQVGYYPVGTATADASPQAASPQTNISSSGTYAVVPGTQTYAV
jgi:hypothetical protein